MSPIGRLAARSTAWALGAVLVVALAGAVVRLLPWMLDPRVPWSAVRAFAVGLVAAGVEIAGLVALPVGFALAASAFADRGEARACLLVGASPLRLAAGLWPLALFVAGLTAAASLVTGGVAQAPGRALQALVDASQAGCSPEGRPVSEVPGTSVAWLCGPDAAPRLAAASDDVAVVARAARVGDDLAAVELEGVSFDLRGPPRLHVVAGVARVEGLGGLGPAPSRMGALARAFATSSAAFFGAIAAAAALIRRQEAHRVTALASGAAAALAAIGVLRAIESRVLSPGAAIAMPLAAGLAPLLVLALRRFSPEARIDAPRPGC